jgi:hypothetical protein
MGVFIISCDFKEENVLKKMNLTKHFGISLRWRLVKGMVGVVSRGGKMGTHTRPDYDPRVPVTRLGYTQTRPV